MKVKLVNRSAYPTPTYYNAINTTVSNDNWNVAFKRVLFFFCLLCMCCACTRPDDLSDLLDGYVFHDEFSYLKTGTEIYEINKSSDNYYLIVKSSDKDEVLKELDRHGFIVTMQPEAYVIKADDYYLPQILEDCE